MVGLGGSSSAAAVATMVARRCLKNGIDGHVRGGSE